MDVTFYTAKQRREWVPWNDSNDQLQSQELILEFRSETGTETSVLRISTVDYWVYLILINSIIFLIPILYCFGAETCYYEQQYGTEPFHSRARLLQGAKFQYDPKLSLLGTCIPWNFHSREYFFVVTFVSRPWTIRSQELSQPGTFVPLECSWHILVRQCHLNMMFLVISTTRNIKLYEYYYVRLSELTSKPMVNVSQ